MVSSGQMCAQLSRTESPVTSFRSYTEVVRSVTVWMFQLFGNSLSLQKLWRCNPELLKEERPIDLTRHWLLRSFSVFYCCRLFLIKMMIIVITMITKCFLSFPCALYVVGEFILILFLAISHRQSTAAWPGSYNGSQLRPTGIGKTNLFSSRELIFT